jgi:hypothetical protein
MAEEDFYEETRKPGKEEKSIIEISWACSSWLPGLLINSFPENKNPRVSSPG